MEGQRADATAATGAAARRRQVAVIGSGADDPDLAGLAEAVGAGLARGGAIVVCGGLGGVMAAACRGAKAAGGTTLGLLPGTDARAGNPWLDVVVPTGLGEARNALVVRSAVAVVAVGGAWGTLSEIALACRAGTPVVGLRTWAPVPPDGSTSPVVAVDDPESAVVEALRRGRAAGSVPEDSAAGPFPGSASGPFPGSASGRFPGSASGRFPGSV